MSVAPEVRRYMRAAYQRLETADILQRHQRYTDAIYLAGYGPECALKSLILQRLPRRRQAEFITTHFRSRKAHGYDFLKELLQSRGEPIPIEIARQIRRINSWSTDLRYEVGRGDEQEARGFLDSARQIVEWRHGRLLSSGCASRPDH